MAAPLATLAAKWAAQKAAERKIKKQQEKKRRDSGNKGKWSAGGGGAVLVIFILVLSLIISFTGALMGILGGMSAITAGGAGAGVVLSCYTNSVPSSQAIADIPAVALEAYQNAGEASGVDWVYIAAIGKIESDHGRFGGRHLDDNGDVQPTPIYGIPTPYGRAAGPMQFIDSTWATSGKDGNFDGVNDVQNIFDAALATGFYLKAGGAPKDMHAAIFSYNHSEDYVAAVLAQAKKYASAASAASVDGGITNPVKGTMSVAQANIPTRSGDAAFASTMHNIIAKNPDFITLNEQSSRSIPLMENSAPGYSAYRDPNPTTDIGGGKNSMETAVMWRTADYDLLDSGRVQIVDNDHTTYDHRPVVWDRYVTWALLKRKSDGAIASIISTHHMTNPGKYGPNKPLRQKMYGQGMDILLNLAQELGSHGPVFVAGDFNVHTNQTEPWTAPSKMTAQGFGYYANSVDYIFYQRSSGIKMVAHTYGPTPEPDHRWVYAKFNMNGATASGSGGPTGTLHTTPTRTAAATAPTADGWVMPMKKGTYTLTAHYGETGGLWSSYHTGQDFSAPTGTPVFAAAAGTITNRTDQSWAGPNLLVIDHGTINGQHVETWYAHLSRDAIKAGHVEAGQLIGYVGALGNVSGPHLHFEVHVGTGGYYDTAVDPMPWLAGAGVPSGDVATDNCGNTGTSGIVNGNGAWGGYENGRIPLSAMCQLSFDPAYLECHAAKAMELLNAAYQKKWHQTVGPVGGYRSYEEQVQCRIEKGNLCAVPGTSNHGWGLAADLAGGGINVAGTPRHNWMLHNAPSYGWVLPDWARPNGSKPEPWHWEFVGTGNKGNNPGSPGPIGGDIGGPPSHHGNVTFRMGDWNMLGASHTEGPGCNKCDWDDSGIRMVRATNAIKASGVDIMTMQEFQTGSQQAAFKHLMGPNWSIYNNKDNAVAWRNDKFHLMAADTFRIPYFGGKPRLMPIVRLRANNGTEFVVISVHNPANAHGPAEKWRIESTNIEGQLTRAVAATGVPVYLNGDMNDREKFFCPLTAYGVMHSANGGSNNNGNCNPPRDIGIDWITGSNGTVTFHGYNKTYAHTGRNGGASDHPYVTATTTAHN